MNDDNGGDAGPLRMNDAWQDPSRSGVWIPVQQAPARPAHPAGERAAGPGDLARAGRRGDVRRDGGRSPTGAGAA